MATSTNYGWAEPDNSSLVKNGASDMRTLGNAIDASLWNVGYGQAGKNRVINGGFDIWQRGTSVAVPANNVQTFQADRFWAQHNGTTNGTITYSRQAFTAGQTDVPNNPTYFARITNTTLGSSQTQTEFGQSIEDVSTYAGQTVTFSFYVKASGSFSLVGYAWQNFGSGGSSSVFTTLTLSTSTTTTSWQRITATLTVPSISGKTVGTGNYIAFYVRQASPTAGSTIDFANWQSEVGSTATPFSRNASSIQGELAACQRYYYRFASEGKTYASFNIGGYFESSTKYIGRHQHPVAMRTNPTVLDYANLSVIDTSGTFYAVSAAAIDTNTNTTLGTMINFTVSGATATRFGSVLINNNTGAYLGIGAEL